MAQLRLVKVGNYLIPSLPKDEESLTRIKRGEVITCDFRKERNWKFHKKFFAMITIVVENTDYETVKQVLHLLKLKLGYFETIINTDGRVTYKTKSISFADMDEVEFNEFYQLAVNKVLSDFLCDWTDENIQRAVEEVCRF